jgi:hypothetical protein
VSDGIPMQAEVFHIHHQGEQRGPYTSRQVNHLHKCGFIDDDTLYWREGMEQWQPITEIVERSQRRNRVFVWSFVLGFGAAIALFVWLFGGVTSEGWKELTAGGFNEESAWWRARGLVRAQLTDGESVAFDTKENAQITLLDKDAATVILGGNLLKSHKHAVWRVRLRYDADRELWLPAPHQEQP